MSKDVQLSMIIFTADSFLLSGAFDNTFKITQKGKYDQI